MKYRNIELCLFLNDIIIIIVPSNDQNKVFIINVSILIINFYSIKIDKTGVTRKTKDDGIYAPLALVIMSAILCYGLADKIYI